MVGQALSFNDDIACRLVYILKTCYVKVLDVAGKTFQVSKF